MNLKYILDIWISIKIKIEHTWGIESASISFIQTENQLSFDIFEWYEVFIFSISFEVVVGLNLRV